MQNGHASAVMTVIVIVVTGAYIADEYVSCLEGFFICRPKTMYQGINENQCIFMLVIKHVLGVN